MNDDFPIPYEYLVDSANDMRKVLIKEEFRAGRIDQRYYQRMCCLELECHRFGCTVDGVFVPSSSVIWEVKLPSLVAGVGDLDILYLGTDQIGTDYVNEGFIRKNFIGWQNLSGNMWTGTKPHFTTVGQYAYIKNPPTSDFKFLCIIALLDNPIAACDWNDDSMEYPVPDDYKLRLLMKKDILSTYGLPQDKINDATDQPNQAGTQTQKIEE